MIKNEILIFLQHPYAVLSIGFVGLYARGKNTPESDIDIKEYVSKEIIHV